MEKKSFFTNPFKPGAGHNPPYLAGRNNETKAFEKLLEQKIILENLVLTGLRGVGKTVLLDKFRGVATARGWLWVGTDLSESCSITEQAMVTRILTDLSVVTSGIILGEKNLERFVGFSRVVEKTEMRLDFYNLSRLFETIPGLTADKLKVILEFVWEQIKGRGICGVIFAYDEAQTISDQRSKEQYPVALLLDVFQSIQRQNIPFMLVLTGLPTLHPKLVDSRTFAERMFRVMFLTRLKEAESRDAISKPIQDAQCPVKFDENSIGLIIKWSAGYPYFIQYICREIYDIFIVQSQRKEKMSAPIDAIVQKLDSDFFAGRWAKVSDRQRDLLYAIAALDNCGTEFTGAEIVEKAKEVLKTPFTSSHVNQMLVALSELGLVYKNRHGRYSFAVPLIEEFIRRQRVLRNVAGE